MKTIIKFAISVLLMSVAAGAMAAGNNSAEYKKAYNCATNALKSGRDVHGECGYGNAADPSKTEVRAWKNAERDYKKSLKTNKNTSAAANNTCTFSYAVYEACNCRADGFEEGPQKVTTLKKVAKLAEGRIFTFYDANGRVIPPDVANRWFVKKGKSGVVISDEAKKTCSAKQRG